MGFVYYTTFIFLDQWLDLNSSFGFLNFLILSFFALMGLISFFLSVIADPGSVPSSFAIDSENPQNKLEIQSRYCDQCRIYKPPRMHHCRICKRRVLKMDHHCVWINNCVGYANCKPYIIFVFHAAMGSIYSLVIFMIFIFQKDQGVSTQSSTIFHYRRAARALWLARKTSQNYRHPYDLGVYYNLMLPCKQILGPNVLKWGLPWARDHLNDGTHFPISNDL